MSQPPRRLHTRGWRTPRSKSSLLLSGPPSPEEPPALLTRGHLLLLPVAAEAGLLHVWGTHRVQNADRRGRGPKTHSRPPPHGTGLTGLPTGWHRRAKPHRMETTRARTLGGHRSRKRCADRPSRRDRSTWHRVGWQGNADGSPSPTPLHPAATLGGGFLISPTKPPAWKTETKTCS